jgi:hypothetical protein
MINNANLLYFDSTAPLERFLFDGNIKKFIGVDLSSGFEYRPLLSDNIVCMFGVSTLIPGEGFFNLFNNFDSRSGALVAGFVNLNLTF